MLGALAALLEIEGDITVVARSRNGKEALRSRAEHKPDVFITDIEMPEMTGLDVAGELKRRHKGTRVIILTTFARAGYLRRALEAGASGYLLKDMRAEELAEAVRRVQQGLRVIDPELATEAWAETGSVDRSRAAGATAGRRRCDAAVTLRRARAFPKERFAIIFPKLSASWARTIGLKPRGSPEPKAGCKSYIVSRRTAEARAYSIPPVFTVRIFNALSSLAMASANSGCSPIRLRNAFSSSWAPETCSITGVFSTFGFGSGAFCDGMGSDLPVVISVGAIRSYHRPLGKSSFAVKLHACQSSRWVVTRDPPTRESAGLRDDGI